MYILFAIVLLIPTLAFADGPYESNGFSLNASVSHFGEKLKLVGRVNAGRACNNLVIAANAKDNDGQTVYFQTSQFDYQEGMNIMFESSAISVNNRKNGWELTAVDAFCGGRPR